MLKQTLILGAICLLGAKAYPNGEKVIGGDESNPGQFPYVVSLQDSKNKTHFCGGTIISNRLILTAANCFVNRQDPADSVVYAGSYDLNKEGVYYNLSQVFLHDVFSTVSLQNNIALLKTATAIKLGANVAVIDLPTDEEMVIPDTTPLVALGFGATRYPDPVYPDRLHYINVDYVQHVLCAYLINNRITVGEMCAGKVDGLGLCLGDGGSPLVLNGTLQVGISSYGEPCSYGYPDVYTRVSFYAGWIEKSVAALMGDL